MKKLLGLVLITAAVFGSSHTQHRPCGSNVGRNGFVDVVKKCKPSVVYIKVRGPAIDPYAGQNPYDLFQDDFFNRFFGAPPPQQRRPQPRPQMSAGSGFIVSHDGYILTNAHVVHDAVQIDVVLDDGTEMPAELVGVDQHTDLAVIKIDGKNFPSLEFDVMSHVEVGEWAIAIGSPFQLEATVTVGVVSAKGRNDLHINDLEDFIQTDAAINPGNSGGPLINIDGKVMGVNAAIVSKSGGYMGIGFAIPCDMAKHVMQQIIDNGTVDRGYIGVWLQPLDKNLAEGFGINGTQGALIAQVAPDSPADKAGLKPGDIITAYNGKPVASDAALRTEIGMMLPGTVVDFTVNRSGKVMNVSIKLGSRSAISGSSSSVAQKMGIEVNDLTPEIRRQLGLAADAQGVVITKVRPDSPAAHDNIAPGSVIMQIDNQTVTSVKEFNEALSNLGKKKRVLILLRRNAQMPPEFHAVTIE